MNGDAACSGLSDLSPFIAPSRERLGPMVEAAPWSIRQANTPVASENSESRCGIACSVAHVSALRRVPATYILIPFHPRLYYIYGCAF